MKKPTLKENFKAFCDTYMSEGGCPLDWEACWNYLEPHLKKTKPTTPLLTKEQEEELQQKTIEFNELFPKVKIPTSGKYARCSTRELAEALRWFIIKNPQFTWDTILKATERYVEEFREKNWAYMRRATFFIRKQNNDKTWLSDLENYCQQIVDDVDNNLDSDRNFYKEKVV